MFFSCFVLLAQPHSREWTESGASPLVCYAGDNPRIFRKKKLQIKNYEKYSIASSASHVTCSLLSFLLLGNTFYTRAIIRFTNDYRECPPGDFLNFLAFSLSSRTIKRERFRRLFANLGVVYFAVSISPRCAFVRRAPAAGRVPSSFSECAG